MTSLITTETVVEIAREIWSAFLSDVDAMLVSEPARDGDGVTGSIAITGAWNGTVDVTCSRAAAWHAASAMYALDEEALTDGDVHDAVGELVNIVGGNLKSLLPTPTDLSLPTVRDTVGAPDAPAGAQCAAEALFVWEVEPLAVRVWSTSGTGGASDGAD